MRRVLALPWHYPPERSRPERQQLRLDLVLERRPARHAFGDCLVDQYSIHARPSGFAIHAPIRTAAMGEVQPFSPWRSVRTNRTGTALP